MVTYIIFRKSANTNAFGLFGYWAYAPATRELVSFASSTRHELQRVLSAGDFDRAELWCAEGIISKTNRQKFERDFIGPGRALRNAMLEAATP